MLRHHSAVLLFLGIVTVGAARAEEPSQSCVAPPPQPLKDLPSGWLHLPQSCIDCWLGAYHDGESGAYVEYHVMPAKKHRGWSETADGKTVTSNIEGTLDGIRYTLVRSPDAHGIMARYLERTTGSRIGDLIVEVRRTLPPVGCDLLSAVFLAEPEAWTFDAAVCDAAQENRVRELLLSRLRLDKAPSGNTRWRAKVVSVADYNALTVGASAGTILSSLV